MSEPTTLAAAAERAPAAGPPRPRRRGAIRTLAGRLRTALLCTTVLALFPEPPVGEGDSGGEQGQTTAEYALVILAAAAVAVVLIAWARSSGKLPAFFDSIIDRIVDGSE